MTNKELEKRVRKLGSVETEQTDEQMSVKFKPSYSVRDGAIVRVERAALLRQRRRELDTLLETRDDLVCFAAFLQFCSLR